MSRDVSTKQRALAMIRLFCLTINYPNSSNSTERHSPMNWGGLTVEDGFNHPSRPGERTARPEQSVTTVRRGGSERRSLGAVRGNFWAVAFRLNESG